MLFVLKKNVVFSGGKFAKCLFYIRRTMDMYNDIVSALLVDIKLSRLFETMSQTTCQLDSIQNSFIVHVIHTKLDHSASSFLTTIPCSNVIYVKIVELF